MTPKKKEQKEMGGGPRHQSEQEMERNGGRDDTIQNKEQTERGIGMTSSRT